MFISSPFSTEGSGSTAGLIDPCVSDPWGSGQFSLWTAFVKEGCEELGILIDKHLIFALRCIVCAGLGPRKCFVFVGTENDVYHVVLGVLVDGTRAVVSSTHSLLILGCLALLPIIKTHFIY